MERSSIKTVYAKFGLSEKVAQIAQDKEKMNALIMLALKHCDCPATFLDALGIDKKMLHGPSESAA